MLEGMSRSVEVERGLFVKAKKAAAFAVSEAFAADAETALGALVAVTVAAAVAVVRERKAASFTSGKKFRPAAVLETTTSFVRNSLQSGTMSVPERPNTAGYSMGQPSPTAIDLVSTPIAWHEVDEGITGGNTSNPTWPRGR